MTGGLPGVSRRGNQTPPTRNDNLSQPAKQAGRLHRSLTGTERACRCYRDIMDAESCPGGHQVAHGTDPGSLVHLAICEVAAVIAVLGEDTWGQGAFNEAAYAASDAARDGTQVRGHALRDNGGRTHLCVDNGLRAALRSVRQHGRSCGRRVPMFTTTFSLRGCWMMWSEYRRSLIDGPVRTKKCSATNKFQVGRAGGEHRCGGGGGR